MYNLDIVDYKDNSFKTRRKWRKSFRQLDKELKKCCSLKEQIIALRDFYQPTTVTRDVLCARHWMLENGKAFGVQEAVLSYQSLFVAIASSGIALFIDRLLNGNADITSMVCNVKTLSWVVIIALLMCLLFVYLEKMDYIFKDIELNLISIV